MGGLIPDRRADAQRRLRAAKIIGITLSVLLIVWCAAIARHAYLRHLKQPHPHDTWDEVEGLVPVAAACLVAVLNSAAWLFVIRSLRRSATDIAIYSGQATFHESLLDRIGDRVTVTDAEGTITYVNAAQARALGYTPAELVGQPVAVFGDDPDRGATQDEMVAMTLQHGHWQGEVANYAKDGSVSMVHLHTWMLTGDDGQPSAMVGIGRDITELKQAQYELQDAHDELEKRVIEQTGQLHESQQRLQTLIANIPGITYRCACDEHWTMELISDAVADITGYAPSDFIDNAVRSYASIIHPDDRQRVEDIILDAVQSETPYSLQYRVVHADGSDRWVYECGQGVFEDGSEVKWLDGVIVEITSHKRAEVALQEGEQQLKALVGSIPGMAYRAMADEDWTTEFISDEVGAISGYPASDFVDNAVRSYESIIHPDDRAGTREHILDAIGAKVPYAAEYRIVHADGDIRWVYDHGRGAYDADGELLWLDGVAVDITEHKRAEDALRESEERLRSTVVSMDDFVFVLDADGVFQDYYQSGGSTHLYLPPEAFLGKHFREVLPESVAGPFANALDALVATGEVQQFDYSMEIDGRPQWFSGKVSLRADADGEIAGVTVVARDVTERTLAEEALRDSECRYRTLYETSRDAIMTLAPPIWKFTAGNPATVDMFHTKDEAEFISLGPWELSPEFQPDGTPSDLKARLMIDKAMKEGSHFFEWTHRRATGEEFPATVLLTRTELGGEVQLQATVRDITERKRAEDALRLANAEWERTFNSVPDLIAIMDDQYRILRVNQSMADRLGLTPAECFGKTCYRAIHNTDGPPDFCPHAQTMADGAGHVVELYEEGLGGHFEVSTSPLLDESGQTIGSVHVAHDISERRQAEEALRRSEAGLRQAQQLAHVGSWEWDLASGTFELSDEMRRIYGLPPEATLRNIQEIIDAVVHPDDQEMIKQAVRDMEAGTFPDIDPITFRVIRPDGEVRWVVDTAAQPRQTDDEGNPITVMGTVHDVTDIREAEEALRESEQRYRAIFDGASEGILVAEAETATFRYANPAIAKMLDRDADDLVGMTVNDIHPPESLETTMAEYDAHVQGRKRQSEAVPCLRKDGQLIYVDISTAKAVIDGTECLVGFFTDVTERAAAARALAESEKRYRQLVENLSEGILALDRQGRVSFVNEALTEMIGQNAEELVGGDFFNSTVDAQKTTFRDSLLSADSNSIIHRVAFRRTDEKLMYLEIQGSPILDDQGQQVGTLAVVNDITQRYQAEEALRASEKRYRQLVESLTEGILAIDTKGTITFANTAATEIIGDTEEMLLNSDFFGSTNRAQQNEFRQMLLDSDGPSEVLQIKFLRRDQKLVYLSMQSSSITDDQGQHAGALVVINDITKRRRAEQLLRAAHRRLMSASEQERRELAKELHDSLGQQAIAMRLAVESLLTGEGDRDAQTAQLEGLSKTCQLLAEEIRAVCYGLYPATLEALGLFAALKQLAEECNPAMPTTLTCAKCLEELRAPPDVEIAMFRIAQEATTNAIRHSRGSELRIDLDRDDDEVILSVSDNGAGFDVQYTETTGLGLRTMRERADALEGTVTITSSADGTTVVVKVPRALSGHGDKQPPESD